MQKIQIPDFLREDMPEPIQQAVEMMPLALMGLPDRERYATMMTMIMGLIGICSMTKGQLAQHDAEEAKACELGMAMVIHDCLKMGLDATDPAKFAEMKRKAQGQKELS